MNVTLAAEFVADMKSYEELGITYNIDWLCGFYQGLSCGTEDYDLVAQLAPMARAMYKGEENVSTLT